MRKTTLTLIAIVGLVFSTASAQVALSPVSVSTAGTFATQSRGDEAIGWNPANLGINDNPGFGMSFGFLPFVPYPSLQLNNDLVSVNWFREWFTKGEYLDEADKADLLSTFPTDGVQFSPLISAKLIGMNFGSFAVSIIPELHTHVTLPKGLFEFVLKGNEFEEPISLEDLSIEVQSVIPISFAYGRQVSIPGLASLVQATYVGGAIKFLAGATNMTTDKFTGRITMYEDRVIAEGEVTGRYAVGGFGTAFDLGAVVDITDKMRANASINNAIGFINWMDTSAEEFQMSFSGELYSSEFEDFGDYSDEQIDSIFNVVDTTFATEPFGSNYPAYMLLGFEYRDILPAFDVYVNYRQNLSDDYYFEYTPRLSAAFQYRPLDWLPLRGGIAVGGFVGFQWGIGFGLNFKHYALDFGFSQDGGMFNSANGFSVSLGQHLYF